MSKLTEAQCTRLREWAAEKMGLYRIAPSTGAWYGPGDKLVHWDPLTDLNQAVMVAEKIDKPTFWMSLYFPDARHPRYRMNIWDSGLKAMHVGEADTPAEALLLACAKACKFEVGE